MDADWGEAAAYYEKPQSSRGDWWEALPDRVVAWRGGKGLEGQVQQIADWIASGHPEWIYLTNLRARAEAARRLRLTVEHPDD